MGQPQLLWAPCASPAPFQLHSLPWNHHLRQELLASFIRLELVDVLHEDPLVLEHVALHLQVQARLLHGAGSGSHVPVDLLGLPVSAEEAPQDPHPPHPRHLLGHASVGSSGDGLTDAHVPALPPGQGVLPAPGARVDGDGLADDEPILDELPDLLPCGKKPPSSTVLQEGSAGTNPAFPKPPPCCWSCFSPSCFSITGKTLF
uniref:Uncharacterized protein n=1 Tax=Strigops habroptila TaxID=2489341 RepID=A0A672U604_STRHB